MWAASEEEESGLLWIFFFDVRACQGKTYPCISSNKKKRILAGVVPLRWLLPPSRSCGCFFLKKNKGRVLVVVLARAFARQGVRGPCSSWSWAPTQSGGVGGAAVGQRRSGSEAAPRWHGSEEFQRKKT
ncbi:hypothetical protein PVAP13_4KG093699 [Panicum virgatum]|uniref:Uncharacterized protein n=1 Tax=Panicum virgatum TaxID=38727 RepID=A0A8T0TK40_PANVG|nr:hypothetical protein PVAP13_4KG093699 [Panicum virgatum]